MFSFLTETIKTYRSVGAVAPSSRYLARAMTRAIREHDGNKRVLEVGPGTGAFTRHVLNHLRSGDEYHLVEVNESFCEKLELQKLQPFRQNNPDVIVELHHSPIETAPLTGTFDYIVCGLPFNNFPLSLVSLIFRQMIGLLKEDGDLTYFEYLGMKALKWPWVGPAGRDRLRRRIAMQKVIHRKYNGQHDFIVRNITPAYAFHLTASATG